MLIGDIRHWSLLLARPFLGPRAIQRYQDRQVRRLVRHAWRHVPYYRRLLEQVGVHPDAITGVADLARLPVSRRVDLQAVPFEARVAAGVSGEGCVNFGTSGSTGSPLRLLRTQREQTMLFGFRLRAQIDSGLRPHHRRVNLGSPPKVFLAHRLGIFRTSNLPLTLSLDEMLAQLEAIRPDVLYGIPNLLEPMVRRYRAERLRRLGVRMVFSGAEPLSRPLHEEIAAAFGCPVTDFYGAHEINLIAWECRRCGQYHTVDDSVVVEVLRDGKPVAPGEDGEIYVTALHSWAMPLIRYQLGDLVRRPAHPRPCPIGFGCLEQVSGRKVDFLPLPSGAHVNPYAVAYALDQLGGLETFQVVQHALDRVEVRFVPSPAAAAELSGQILSCVRPLFPPEVALAVQAVGEIPPGPSGKRHRVIAFRG
jgi:phenylacetate-CoA ligase